MVDTVANQRDRRREPPAVWDFANMPGRRIDGLSYLGHPTDWTLMSIVLPVVMVVGILAGCRERWAVLLDTLTIRRQIRAHMQHQVQRWCDREGGVPEQEEASDKFCVFTGHQPFPISATPAFHSGKFQINQSTV